MKNFWKGNSFPFNDFFIFLPVFSLFNKQILQGHSLNIKIDPLEVSNIQRGAAELNIITTRVDKSYVQQEWACYICFIIYLYYIVQF